MPIILVLAAVVFAGHYHAEQQRHQSRYKASYRHPAMAPATIYSPEFYASLSARYNRPFLGK